jgi:hypothetical protein
MKHTEIHARKIVIVKVFVLVMKQHGLAITLDTRDIIQYKAKLIVYHINESHDSKLIVERTRITRMKCY